MKKLLMLILSGIMVMAVSGLIFIGCTKEGPQGPAGANGTNGKDANATCTLCHNFSDTVIVKMFQYNASKHASGSTTLEAARVGASCSGCHSHEGFLEKLQTGSTVTQAYPDAAPINCRTCHLIHTTYTPSDWTLRSVTPVHPYIDTTSTIDLTVSLNGGTPDGTSNLCGKCHQARKVSPWITNPQSDTDSLSVNSNRWGPHHGPQFLMLAGKGAFEMGSSAFGSTNHKGNATCRNCHMGSAQGDNVGGHTLIMSSTETGDNVAVCKPCHTSIGTTFDYNGVQTEIYTKFNTLKTLLGNANILDTVSTSINYMLLKGVSAAHPKKFSQKELSVFWNFQLVYADRSMGVHNHAYIRDMLDAGIAYFSAK
jgi:nitrate/TMAO reductase-like tetraheme cytochrome c subunit